ncbi:MAG TPA: type II CAAX endopeptidase family protein [Dongiaceae bacterium]|nr:type II CAAX endopeptidase family protein [Dongiaceae bacterium]
MTIGLPVWVLVGFILAQVMIALLVEGMVRLGVPLAGVDAILFNVIAGFVIYLLAIAIVICAPWYIKKYRTTRKELGIQRAPVWMDVAWTLTGFVAYIILSAIVTTLAGYLLPFINMDQTQDTGYSNLSSPVNYVLAFIGLVVVAPMAEELLFRGYLFGKLQKHTKIWVSVLVTSALFGFVHFQWNVGLDVFALSIVLCLLRIYSGSLWSSIFLHMTKNGLAYFFLFINPHFLSTLIK